MSATFGKIGTRDLVWKPPYDAEVEWLSNGGTAYIDSGVYACAGIGFEVTAMGDTSWTTGYPTGWGNDYEPSHTAKWTFDCYTGNQYRQLRYAVGLSRLSIIQLNLGTKAMQTGFVTFGIDTQTGELKFNGVVKVSGLYLPLEQSSTWPSLKVFARNASNKNTAPNISANNFKISHFIFTINGEIVRNFIPVRAGSVGYMFDRANIKGGPLGNGLYPNVGSGAFVLGPDKVGG